LSFDIFQSLCFSFEVKETPECERIFPLDCVVRLKDHENPRKTLAMSAACVKNRNYSEELRPEPRLTAKEADP
jgi:hypothetical protein